MKPIEQTTDAIRYLLLQSAAVVAIVGSKIRPDTAGPTDAPPYIVMNSQGTTVPTKDGNNTTAQVMVTLEMYHTNKDDLRTLCAEVRKALDNQSGSFDAVVCQSITFDDEQSGYEDNAQLEGLYSHLHDYMVWVNTTNTAQLAPQFVKNPVIYANLAGTVLTCFPGIVTGGQPITMSYQWQRNGSNITNATAVTYNLQPADDNQAITCIVTATGTSVVSQVSNTYVPSAACADGTVTNSNDTYTLAVPSGSTRELPDTTYNIYVNSVFQASTSLPTLAP